jgi:glycosyltransferase involved in cell wall biosynthesis
MNNFSSCLSIIVPAFNEAEVLPEFHRRLGEVLDNMHYNSEIVYVNDGSTDNTLGIIEQLAAQDRRVALVDMSRNYGKEIALTAGLDHTHGDATIVIDADLQDPPELIPELVQAWNEGYDVVYAQRTERAGETWLKKLTAKQFYKLMQYFSRVPVPPDTGDFRLLSRRAVNAVCQLREQNRFMKGLFSWIGYPQKSIPYKRESRHAGTTKWNYWKLWNFALDGITAFTTAPLRFATYIGTITALVAFVYGLSIILRTLYYGIDVPGYASLMVVILFIGGVQLTALGIIGEYLGRTFDEVKRRPLYFVQRYTPAAASEPPQQSDTTG